MTGFAISFYWRVKYKHFQAIDDHTTDVSTLDPFMSVFMVTFGDFGETEGYTTSWDYIFFFLAVFLICLIMMNLLIGVLSEELATILGI